MAKDRYMKIYEDDAKELGLSTAAVYTQVRFACGLKDGMCWAGVGTLAANTGLAPRTVRLALKRLLDEGWLGCIKRPGQTDWYKLTDTRQAIERNRAEQVATPANFATPTPAESATENEEVINEDGIESDSYSESSQQATPIGQPAVGDENPDDPNWIWNGDGWTPRAKFNGRYHMVALEERHPLERADD